MKTLTILLLTLLTASASTNQFLQKLQAGLLEEEVNRNLDAAITIYSNLVTQADADRAIFANALFRLAESYRKSGKTNEATAAYQKLLQHYPEQNSLRMIAQTQLAALGIPTTANVDVVSEDDQQIALYSKMLKTSPDALLNGNELYAAVSASKLDIARFLITNGVPVNGLARNPFGPIHVAAYLGNIQMLQVLISNGADVNLKTTSSTFLYPAPTNLPPVRFSVGDTALHSAAAMGHLKVCEMLLEHGARLDNEGVTPLHRAAQGGHLQVCKLLVERGASVNAHSNDGETPLALSLHARVPEVSKFLLDNGAKIEISLLNGASLLGKAASMYPEALPLLLSYKPNLEATPARMLPIRTATSAGSSSFRGLELLLQAGANPNTKCDDGAAPLHAAVAQRPQWPAMLGAIKMLLRFKTDPNISDNFGRTPLHYAVLLKDSEATALLLQAGANPLLKDKQGYSPLSFVEQNHYFSGKPYEMDIGKLHPNRSGGGEYPQDIGNQVREAAKKFDGG